MEGPVRPRALIHFPSPEPREAPQNGALVVPFTPSAKVEPFPGGSGRSVRLAVYPSRGGSPEVFDVLAEDPGALLAEACRRSARCVQEQGSPVPVAAVVAVVENLIHAHFRLAAVCIGPDGTVAVSDQGPGIPDKRRALLPGFTTATAEMRRYIRGVGSGLAIASALMERSGGELRIEDNLGGGTVVSLLPPSAAGRVSSRRDDPPREAPAGEPADPVGPPPPLTPRQRRLLLLLADAGEIGPSSASQQLGLSLTTAFRELVALESHGLVVAGPAGKRRLSPRGLAVAERLLVEGEREGIGRTAP